ncbi:MAG: hypothetical protein PHZ07_00670 [Patescibacteria group bacterium]|nr:hypothetical protein [Patescibacteria group bacterium]MDD4304782.1 hypothetical protein [Patescibacteria group bacterium]MDD4695267.1 hypothetical protein [Patescibacteria group bacterium]
MKSRVHFGFSVIVLDKEDIKFLDGGSKIMKHIKILDLKSIDEVKLKKTIGIVYKKVKYVGC